MPFRSGRICGAGRSSSRMSTSWFSMKSFGWPAIEGIPALTELPSGPWHCRQAIARG